MAQQFCLSYRKVAWAVTGPKQAVFTRLRCKQWSCAFCAKKNAAEWKKHLTQRLPEVSEHWWMLTLTAPSHKRGHLESIAAIRDNLERFFKRMRRVFGEIEYVRVYEKHPDSEAIHCHVIVSGLAPYVALGHSVKHQAVAIGVYSRKGRNGVWALRTWIKKTARSCGMGYICDIQAIDDPIRAMLYIVKYLTKALQNIQVAYLRHVQVTKGIGSPQSVSEDVWACGSYITAYTFEAGTRIKDLNTKKMIDNDYWEVKSFYPDDMLTD
jgi:hypothetical protein